MNEYSGIGNLTRDPHYGQKGDTRYCSFTLAVNNRNHDPTYLNVVTFGNRAEVCRDYLQKGSQVLVRGRPEAEVFEDRDGKPKAGIKIVADRVQFLSRTRQREKTRADDNTHKAADVDEDEMEM